MIIRRDPFAYINLNSKKMWYDTYLLIRSGVFTCSDKVIKRRDYEH